MPTIIKHVGRLAALLVAGVLAMTVLSTAPSSASPARSNAPLAASTSADTTVAARTLARRAPACWRRHHKCYGSIAFNPKRVTGANGGVYFANDTMTKRAATKAALKKCRKVSRYHNYCKSAGWVRDYCLGLAIRVPGGTTTVTQWASAGAANKTKAMNKAAAKLGGPARNHHKWAYLCTTRKG